jgi:hypothetical protein
MKDKNNVDILQIDRNLKKELVEHPTHPTPEFSGFPQPTHTQDITITDFIKEKIQEQQKTKNEYTEKNNKNFYLLDTSEIIQNYMQTLQTPIKIDFMSSVVDMENSKINQEKEQLIEDYLNVVRNYSTDSSIPFSIKEQLIHLHTNNNLIPTEQQKCSICDSTDITESTDFLGIMICLDCGNQETTLNLANSIRLNHNDSKRVNLCSKYSYDKKSHFLNCINQYQGKHKAKIDQEVIDLIIAELDKYKLIDHSKKTKRAKFKNVTKEHIFLFIKELKLTKSYGDINLIYHLITDNPLQDITHLQDKLLQDFEQFVQMYFKMFPIDTERKNFNYQHLLYQLLMRHKVSCDQSDFNFLKTIERKTYHDQICQKIFEELGWNYTPLF